MKDRAKDCAEALDYILTHPDKALLPALKRSKEARARFGDAIANTRGMSRARVQAIISEALHISQRKAVKQ